MAGMAPSRVSLSKRLIAMLTDTFITFDLEVTTQRIDGEIDGSPFNPENQIVMMQWQECIKGELQPVQIATLYHNEQDVPDSPAPFRDALDRHEVGVAHNMKFDAQWLTQIGWTLPKHLHCTMLREFALAGGRQWALGLEETAKRYGVAPKKSALVSEFKRGKCYSEIDLAAVKEYGIADVQACSEIYLRQNELFSQPPHNGLVPILQLYEEMQGFLLDTEENGIYVDREALREVGEELAAEQKDLQDWLQRSAQAQVGDTPINLNSGADINKVLFGIEVTDKEKHKQNFNLGKDENGRDRFPPRMKPTVFERTFKETTQRVYKSEMHCCHDCGGRGTTPKFKKDGTLFKKLPKCVTCGGEGVLYLATNKKAGFGLKLDGPEDVSVFGYKTDKDAIERLISYAKHKNKLEAAAFLEKKQRLTAVTMYLSNFVGGMTKYTRKSGLLHTSFNQHIAKTGRLSSTRPNLQNIPKHGNFPVRRVVKSRWDNFIIESDYSGLEMRISGELSRDNQVLEDIRNGKDIHSQTASIIHQIPIEQVTKAQRSASKSFSFLPLFGGTGNGMEAHVKTYIKEFFNIYKGVREYHLKCFDDIMRDKHISIPSGKQFWFDNPERTGNGEITGATRVKNYPVQGLAAIVVCLACIRALRLFRQNRLRSVIILTIHDSIIADIYPGEEKIARELIEEAMLGAPEEFSERFNYKWEMPLAVETEMGKNWLEMMVI